MKNKILIAYLIVASVFIGCRGPVKGENKNNAPVDSSSLHARDEKYIAIDTKESVVGWKGSNSFGAHTGYVYISKGELMVENGYLVRGTVEIDMNTIEDESHGRNSGLINHLKDPDFFDVQKFPFSTISINNGGLIDNENKEIWGNLTIKGIMHPVPFPVKMEMKDGVFKANARLVIDRTEWGIRYNSGKFFDKLADKTISDSIEFDIKIVAKPYKDSLAHAAYLINEIYKERDAGTIYQSTSPHHNLVHEFTYLVVMRDFCTKTLSQMRANSDVNKKLYKELERELLNANAALASAKFIGLKIESDYYELFLKNINDKFTDKC